MTPEQLKYFEERLLKAQVASLGVEDLFESDAENINSYQMNAGRLSMSDAMQRHTIPQLSDQGQDQSLMLIKHALERIDDGIYGECIECLAKIPEAQLEIDPALAKCVNCAESE